MTTGTLHALGVIESPATGEEVIGALITLNPADLKHLANLIGERVTITAATLDPATVAESNLEAAMADAPERIWATASDDGWLAPYCGLFPCKGATEYIRRADLAPTDAQVMAHPKVKALVEAASGYRRAIDAFDGSGSMTNKIAAVQAWRDALDAALRDLEDGNG